MHPPPPFPQLQNHIIQWRSQVGAQGARAPPSALGLVGMVHRTASSSTLLATPNSHLLRKYSLEDSQTLILFQDLAENLELARYSYVQNAFSVTI